MIDLVIKGGTVVTPSGVGQWDVAVVNGKVAAITDPNVLPGDIGKIIDATGKIVVPGGIEPHAHVATPVVFGNREAKTAPPEQISAAAIWGGTTTVTDFATRWTGVDLFNCIEVRNSRWKGNAYCDYSYHPMLLGDVPEYIIEQIPELIKAGFPTFKLFTTHVFDRPEMQGAMMGMGRISALMEKAAENDGLIMVHAEDDDIVQYMYQKLAKEERTEWFNVHEVHNNLSEHLSFRRMIDLAKWTGAATYFVHVSAKEGVRSIKQAREQGLPIYGETLHNYLCFTSEDYKKADGAKYHTYPALKTEDDRLALWSGLLDSGVSTVGTDEYCVNLELKLIGRTISDVTGGHNGTETRMGITFSEGVSKRGMLLQRFVDVTSTNAAKLLGYYPRKGAILPGSDADIVLIDPNLRKTLSMNNLHQSDYSIWDGWEVQGWPVTTILRGKVVVDNGQFLGIPQDGQLILRKIDSEVLRRPVC